MFCMATAFILKLFNGDSVPHYCGSSMNVFARFFRYILDGSIVAKACCDVNGDLPGYLIFFLSE